MTAVNHDTFLCFQSLNIPGNAVIDKAVITLTSYTLNTQNGPCTVTVDAACDTAPEPIEHGNEGSSAFINVTRTASYVDWSIDELGQTEAFSTPNLATIVQELLSLTPGPLQDIMFFVNNNVSEDLMLCYGPDNAFHRPKLDIWYHTEANETGESGTLAGGKAGVSVVSSRTSQGGAVAGGESYLPPIIEIETTGGIVVSGEAVLLEIIVQEASGGVVAGGEALLVNVKQMSGGCVVSGSVSIGGTIIPKGGVVVGQGTYSNGYKYRLPFVTTPRQHYLERFYPVIVAYVEPESIETGTDFHVEDDGGNAVPHSLRTFDEETGKVVFSIKTPLHTSGNSFWLYYGRS